jgi:integrase
MSIAIAFLDRGWYKRNMAPMTPRLTPSSGTAGEKQKWPELVAALGFKGKLLEESQPLTETIVERTRTKPLGFRYELRDGRVQGLALRVGATGDGTWTLTYRTRTGERSRYRLGPEASTSLKEARAEAMRVLAAVRDGANPAAEKRAAKKVEQEEARKVSLRAFVEGEYCERVLSHRKDGFPAKERIPKAFASIADKPLAAITREDIEKALSTRRAAGLAAATVHRDWGALRAALSMAVEWGRIPVIPMHKLPLPLRGWRPAKRDRYVGERGTDERERFVTALTAREARIETDDVARLLVFAVKLAWATGMRRGEILGLRDAEVGASTIALAPNRTKNGRGRVVRLSTGAKEALKLWKLRGTRGEFFPGYLDEEGKLGPAHIVWRAKLRRAWLDLCEEAKVENLHLHDVRHTFATDLRKAGTALEVVREAMGHEDLRATQRYAHVGQDEVAAAVEKVRIP